MSDLTKVVNYVSKIVIFNQRSKENSDKVFAQSNVEGQTWFCWICNLVNQIIVMCIVSHISKTLCYVRTKINNFLWNFSVLLKVTVFWNISAFSILTSLTTFQTCLLRQFLGTHRPDDACKLAYTNTPWKRSLVV